jgi:hypothetical protein
MEMDADGHRLDSYMPEVPVDTVWISDGESTRWFRRPRPVRSIEGRGPLSATQIR